MNTLGVVIAVISICAVLFSVGQLQLIRRDKRIKMERSGESFQTFRSYFTAEEVSEDILRRVYEYFQGWKGDSEFPVRATDSIRTMYGIVDEDFREMLARLAVSCSCRHPLQEYEEKVDTVEDLVRLLANARQ